MPPTAFTLQVPADAKYADVAADAARKAVELMGGAAGEAAAFAGAVVEVVRAGVAAGNPVTCVFSLQPGGVEAVVTAGAAGPSIVRQPIAVRSSGA
jgi:hypothetical protein